MLRHAWALRCAATPPSAAGSELAERLRNRSAQPKKKKDPAKATKLIDRLKDVQLTGHWAKAVSLFDTYPAESRQWRWQSFHYRCLLQVLSNAKQGEPLERIWNEMKLRPELAIDEEGANDALQIAASTGGSDALVEDILDMFQQRGFEQKMRARRALDRRHVSNWQAALADVGQRVEVHRAMNGDDAPAPASIADELGALALRHKRNGDAVEAISVAFAAAKVNMSGDAYAARIRAAGKDWEAALAILEECRTTSVPTTRTYNETLSCLWYSRKSELMDRVREEMTGEASSHGPIAPDKRTVELVLRHFETTPRWQEATSFFMNAKAAGVPPTNACYSSLIKAYNRGGQTARVMTVFDAMRKDGFQGEAKDTVSLINAWSSNRLNRYRSGRG